MIEHPDQPMDVRRRKRTRKIKVVRSIRATPGGNGNAVERDVPVDVPKFRLTHSDEFEQPWHLALWAPNAPDGPTVLINMDSSILQEVVDYHLVQYADIYADEVSKTVRQVFGEVAACKIAHSQKLARLVPEEQLDREYRSEQALTVALMGLMAEESLIAQWLGRFGKKQSSAPIVNTVGTSS